jgi:hypothetical protein
MNAIRENLLLLTLVRKELASYLSEKAKTPRRKKQIQNLVLNELSDYQLLEMVTTGKIVPNDKNYIRELILLDEFSRKASHILNQILPSEMGKEKEEIIQTISSAVPLRSFGVSSKLSEARVFFQKGGKKLPDLTPAKLSETKKRIRKDLAAMLIREASLSFDPSVGIEYANYAKTLLSEQGGELPSVSSAVSSAKEFVSNLGAMAGKTSSEISKMVSDFAAKARQGMEDIIDAVRNSPQVSPDDIMSKIRSLGPAAYMVAGVALAALIIYASKKVYDRYFSAAAKACSNKKGAEKSMCIKKYKAEALRKREAQLRRSIVICGKVRNSKKCANRIQAKIKEIRNKIKKMV